jgi:nitrogenase iron protein NifH
MKNTIRLVIYGKGGIGKSTIACHLSAAYGEMGLKVLHVGCDPKMDSSFRLIKSDEFPTLVDFVEDRTLERRKPSDLIIPGKWNIDAIETGGPEPGLGCAGRGVATLFDFFAKHHLEKWDYDVMVFDVLGDLVCGGFVAPIRYGMCNRVVIVAGSELMSLYAANNIARVVINHVDEDVRLAGIIYNVKSSSRKIREELDRFAGLLNARVLCYIPWNKQIKKAERLNQTLFEYDPQSESAYCFRRLAQMLLEPLPDTLPLPTPMSRKEFIKFARSLNL